MIARTWRGAVRTDDAARYADYPEDDAFLVERDTRVTHYLVAHEAHPAA